MTTSAEARNRRVVTVVKQKLHGGRGCWQGYEVGHDTDGLWLFTPAGSTFRSSDGERDDQCEVEGGDRPGLVAVEDLDDFAEARDAGLLGDEDAECALRCAAWVERALKRQTTPFDGRGDQRLADAGRWGLPALVDVPHPFDI